MTLTRCGSVVTVMALTLLAPSAQARGGRVSFGGGISVNIDSDSQGSADSLVFGVAIALAVLTFIIFFASFIHLVPPKPPVQDFPLKKLFGILALCASATLTFYYALFTWAWHAEHQQHKSVPLAAHAIMGLAFRVKDILIYASMFVLLCHRRDAFLAAVKYRTAVTSSEKRVIRGLPMTLIRSPFYRIAPWVCFGVLIVTTVVRFGLSFVRRFDSFSARSYDGINIADQVMAHLFLAFDFSLTIILATMVLFLSFLVKHFPSHSYLYYDQYVLGGIIKILPPLAMRALWELATQIVVYTRGIASSINGAAFETSGVFIDGILYFWIFGVLVVRTGQPPEVK